MACDYLYDPRKWKSDLYVESSRSCVCVAFREVVRVKCSVLNHKTESAERCGNYKNESKNIGLFKSIQRMDEAHNFKLLKLLFHRSALCSRPKHLHLFGCLKFSNRLNGCKIFGRWLEYAWGLRLMHTFASNKSDSKIKFERWKLVIS